MDVNAPGGDVRSARSSDDWPLVGRAGELDVLRRAMQDGPGAIITGDLGVGKSRLAAALTAELVAEGWTTSAHVATEARQAVPFSAFTALLDDAGDDRNPLQLLLDGAARLDTGEAPVVLHVEDGHWLDDESLAFVQQVAESTTATVLLTLRSGLPSSPRLITLARALGLRRLEVQALSRDEVADLLNSLVPGISRSEIHRLWELTAGNPLYLHEVVTRSLEQDSPTRQDEGLVLAPVDHTGLADLVGGRLDDLAPGQQEVLEVLAVAPGAPLDLLYRCAGTDGFVELQRRQLVVVAESGHRLVATLAHPIYAEVVTARMGAATRRIRRRQVLAEVEAHGSRRGSDLIQSALWADEQGDAMDPQALLAVARRLTGLVSSVSESSHGARGSVRGGLQTSAARLAKAAVTAGGGFEAADLWFKIESHRDGASRATAEALAAMYELAATDEEETRVAITTSGLEAMLGRSAPGDALGDLEALPRSTGRAELSRAVDAWRVVHLMLNGDSQRAVELGREVLADEATHPRDRLLLAGPLIGSMLLLGLTGEALATADQMLSQVRVDDDQSDLGALVFGRLLALSNAGRVEEADNVAAQMVALAEATGNDLGLALFAMGRAQSALIEGRPRDALAAASASIAARADTAAVALIGTYGPAHAVLAHSHAVLGNREEAATALARMAAAGKQDLLFPFVTVLANAWVAEGEGRHRTAISTLRAGVDRAVGGVPGRMLYLRDLARLGERGCGAEMEAIVDAGADRDPWAGCVAYAWARDADDGPALDAASIELERVGQRLVAAEASAQAANCHGVAGDRDAAVASRDRSRTLAARCQGARTPGLEVKMSAVRELAPRELEVARLAGRGVTNREIADELGISVRTVETYLYRIFFKLGVESRAELASHPEL